VTGPGWMVEVRFPAGKDFCLCHNVQTGSGAHPASYPMGTRVLCSGVKCLRPEASRTPPSSAKVENTWSCTSTSCTSAWHGP
jgi:hypothetical protein